MTNPNDMAFPISNEYVAASGLSKREYFAAMALSGIIREADMEYDPNDIAEYAVKAADALVAKLNKE